MAKPFPIQAQAQAHARPVQDHRTIGRADRQGLTDGVDIHVHDFAHREYQRHALGHPAGAFFVHAPELARFERGIRLLPGLRLVRAIPVAALIEQHIEIVELLVVGAAGQRCFAALLADQVDDLVLEDAGKLGA